LGKLKGGEKGDINQTAWKGKRNYHAILPKEGHEKRPKRKKPRKKAPETKMKKKENRFQGREKKPSRVKKK